MSFKVTAGHVTYELDCELLENMAETVEDTEENVLLIRQGLRIIDNRLAIIEDKVDQILNAMGVAGQLRVEFTIGPVTEQKREG